MRLMRAIAIAFSTYSRIPMPRVDWSEENQRSSMCFFPLVGLAVGLALWLWLWLCDLWALGAFARGAIGAALPLLVSGGIHMDGFMDTLDAMASWQPREKRLEILKDVHTGAFAVMGCGAYLLAMAGILSEARADQGLAIAACFVLSRALSALALVWFPKRADQLPIQDVFARSGRIQAADQVHQRGFAAARGAQDGKELARLDVQVDPLQNPLLFPTHAVGFHNVPHPEKFTGHGL